MKVKPTYLCLVLISFFISAKAQQTGKTSPAGTCFLEYLPNGYNTNSDHYPIVISLHGIGEKGNTLADLTEVGRVSLAKYVNAGTQYPFILISPQLKTTMGSWTGDYVIEVLNYVKTI